VSGCPGWQSVNPLCRAGQVLGGAAKEAGSDVFGAIADYFAGAANAAVSWLWLQLNQATSVDLTSPGIKADLIATGAIAALITFALFVIQLIASIIRQDPGGLGRGVRGLGVAFIGAAFAVAATQLVLAAVDQLASGVVRFALGTDLQGMGSKLIVAHTLTSIGNPAGLLLISLVLIAAVVVVWVALMVRKMLIIVSAVFAPVAFSGAASDGSRSWVRKWIEFTLALVFSKLVLVIIFMIGLSVLNGAGQQSQGGGKVTASMTSLVIGALILLLAGFAPWIAIKLVHFAADSFQAVHAHGASTTAGARTVVAMPQKVMAAKAAPSTLLATRTSTRPAAFSGAAQAKRDAGPLSRRIPTGGSAAAAREPAGAGANSRASAAQAGPTARSPREPTTPARPVRRESDR
jgi:hypothetical protein